MNLPSSVESPYRRELRRQGRLGLLLVLVLFGGLVIWASMTEIAGAVIASGSVAVEGRARQVQHHEGGIVLEIHARNGDRVEAGDLLLRLDATMIEAGLTIIEAQLRDALATEARLSAEITGNADLMIDSEYAELVSSEDLAAALDAQRQILDARTAVREARIRQIEEQIVQIEDQINGLQAQQEATERLRTILIGEIADLSSLRADGLVQATRVTTLEKELAELDGQIGVITFEVARTRSAISERQIQIAQLQDDNLDQSLQELQSAHRTVVEASQRALAERDALRRLEVRAPSSGIVYESLVNTVGSVVEAGSTMMLIVPQEEALVVAARVAPADIDKIAYGQVAILRLSAFNARSTPELQGEVVTISPDLSQDPYTGMRYYAVEVSIAPEELDRLPNGSGLVPGMPVDVFLKTEDRSVLSYIVRPLTDQIALAFREE